MSSRPHKISSKPASNSGSTNLFAPRPFKVQPQPKQVSPQQATPEKQAQQQQAPLEQQQPEKNDSAMPKFLVQPRRYQPPLPPRIQMKLSIGVPGDKYEQEADKVAVDVVRQINAPQNLTVQPQVEVNQQSAPKQQQLEKNDSGMPKFTVHSPGYQPPPPPRVQMKLSIRQPGEEDESFATREGYRTPLQPKLQRVTEGGMAASSDLEAGIQQARGSGQPLVDSIREPMEQAFGADFSGVRIHADSQADQLNQSIQAKAFTTGQDVFFRQGAYNPGSQGGQQLLAHELTHVLQQSSAVLHRAKITEQPQVKDISETAMLEWEQDILQAKCAICTEEEKEEEKRLIQPKLSIGQVGDPYEQEADRVASEVVKRIHTPVLLLAGQTYSGIQRLASLSSINQPPIDRTKPEISYQRFSHSSTNSFFPAVTQGTQMPMIQRDVSFTLREQNGAGLMNRTIVHANTGDRVDFIETRLRNLNCSQGEDRRHIIGYNLIAQSLRKMVKNQTVQNIYNWLQQDTSWVNQDPTYLRQDKARVTQTVPGVEEGLTQWLRNANSFEPNLFCGSSTINRRKGASVPAMRRRVKQTWQGSKIHYQTILSIKATDKRSNQPTFFICFGRYYRDEVKLEHNTAINNKGNFSGIGTIFSFPGVVITIRYLDTNSNLQTVTGGAFEYNPLMGAQSNFFRQISRENKSPDLEPLTMDLESARQGFLANTVDLNEAQGYNTQYRTVIANSIKVQAPNGVQQPIANVAMGEKYEPLNAPSPKYHQKADTIQRTSLDSQPKTVPVQHLKAADANWPGHPQDRQQSMQISPLLSSIPLIQRKVSLNLQDNRANVMNEVIVSVNPGERPPILNSRVASCPLGKARRHKIGYDLIAQSLKQLLKYKTVNQIADWLDHEPNWLDQEYLNIDRQPLDQDKTIRTLGAVEAMTTQWLLNAQNNKSNFFCGNADINTRKGVAIAGWRSQVKEAWGGQAHNLNNVNEIRCADKIIFNFGETFNYGGILTNQVMNPQLMHDAGAGGKLITAAPGKVLYTQDNTNNWHLLGGAAYIFNNNGSNWIRRVSRSFNPTAHVSEFARQQTAEQGQQGFVANEIDTKEPNLTSSNPQYTQQYAPHLNELALLEPVQTAEYNNKKQRYISTANDELRSNYQRLLSIYNYQQRHRPRTYTQREHPFARNPQPQQSQKQPPRKPFYWDDRTLTIFLNSQGQNEQQTKTTLAAAWGVQLNGNWQHIGRSIEAVQQAIRTIGPLPVAKGIADWALDMSGGKYRPLNLPADNYHQAADRQTMFLTVAKSELNHWQQKPTIPPQKPLLTRLLKIDDLTFIFNGSSFVNGIELLWIQKALHDKNRGCDLGTFNSKVDGARDTSLTNKEDIKQAFTDAVSNHWIVFPTSW